VELRAGQVAVVTGAASGIGRALALALASRGLDVVMADVEAGALEAAADTVVASGGGGRVEAVVTDVADGASVGALADRAFALGGGVHLLCNNAGVFQGGLLWEVSDADWEWVLGVNVRGIVHGVRSFVPRMIDTGVPGHVLNTASMASFFAAPFSGPYTVSKHAAYALTETLAHDLLAVGAPIGVSVLCPSAIDTGIGRSRRNRPEALAGALTEAGAFVEQALVDTVGAGISPAEAARLALEAVERGDFLVPTKPSYAPQIRRRTDALLERRLPEVPEID
jgi:NAD(P)-dependent dehydrogenase (short-subunit alcohol dehydrogenase family)